MQEYKHEFERKQYSTNPFERVAYQRHQKYMEQMSAKNKIKTDSKKKEIKQPMIEGVERGAGEE